MYLLHVFGMDVIHGAWEVLFNLYLLQLGFGIEFIGIRIAVMGAVGAISSIPVGKFSDKIDRKWGFIIGDGGGAITSLILITSTSGNMILAFSAIGAIFGTLHHVTEIPFMAENSAKEERVHLFSVGSGFRTLAAMMGAIVAGYLPAYLSTLYDNITLVEAYRLAVEFSIAWWFLSLIPAFLLQRYESEEDAKARSEVVLKKGLFGGIQNPIVIRRFIIISSLLSFGAGFVLRLANVFFHEHGGIHADEHQIGIIFAVGSLFLSIGAFIVPLIVDRIGDVTTIVITRASAIPFILIIGFAPSLASPESVVSLAGLAWVLRSSLFNMSSPVMEAYSMGMLHPNERATFVGLSRFFGASLAAIAGYGGAYLMAMDDFGTPFIIMSVFYAISTLLFYQWFVKRPISDPEKPTKFNLEDPRQSR